MPPTWIAEEQVIFVHPDGQRNVGRIALGLPVEVDATEATCPVALDGFHRIHGPIHGGSTLQALLLAMQFLGMRLHDFVSKGGRVLYPDDDADVPLHALFGALLREATVVPERDASGDAE
jgi:hypothetical protein